MASLQKDSKIVIVGAGVFGLSTAEHLLKRGYTSVTILDRSNVLPAPDAASCDINKIVRSSYSDPFYTELARDAMELWKDRNLWGDTYHECGVFVVANGGNESYADGAYHNDIKFGARIKDLLSPAEIQPIFPPGVKTSSFEGFASYINLDGGWANASQGISLLIDRVTNLGAQVIPGKAVTELVKDSHGRTSGVRCADDSAYEAELVVIASGSWTPSSFPQLELYNNCLATGQTVATIQLTAEEAETYRKCPVVLDFRTGFYIFPPNVDNKVKFALHGSGFLHRPSAPDGPSTPRTKLSDGDDGLRIPREAVKDMRTYLSQIYPELAQKPFDSTRLCWYNDSTDDDWVIGFHPSDPGVMLATSGSGHAYKFLPNIGRLVADAIEGKLGEDLVKKFAVDRVKNAHVQWRAGLLHRPLNLDDLCTPEDLFPV
ncbi:FAD dependent oxidoreductase [Trametopsis cervina]|nr:FAD dependent oxidoreductase [Trametopsis cervina]